MLITAAVEFGHGSAAAPSLVEPTFVRSVTSVGQAGWEVATGDVNGDGDVDIVSTNQFSDSVSLMLGNGDGTFSDDVEYAAGDTPRAVTTGDLNGDGNDDVIIGGDDMNVSVFVANGDGTLAALVAYPIGDAFPRNLVTGDVDGDDDLDVVAGRSGGVSLFRGNGDGTLGAPTSAAGGAGDAVALADLDGDNDLDLVEQDAGPGVGVAILLGDGAGGFAPHQFLSADVRRADQVLAVTDLNGDSSLDVVALGRSNQVFVALGRGDGSFDDPTSSCCRTTPSPSPPAT